MTRKLNNSQLLWNKNIEEKYKQDKLKIKNKEGKRIKKDE